MRALISGGNRLCTTTAPSSSCQKVTPPGSARATVTGGTVTGGEDYLLVSLPPGFVGVLSLFVSCASENFPRKDVRV